MDSKFWQQRWQDGRIGFHKSDVNPQLTEYFSELAVPIGSVIDFLNIGIGPVRTGIFNVADVAIMAGVSMVLWEVLRNSYTSAVSTIRN